MSVLLLSRLPSGKVGERFSFVGASVQAKLANTSARDLLLFRLLPPRTLELSWLSRWAMAEVRSVSDTEKVLKGSRSGLSLHRKEKTSRIIRGSWADVKDEDDDDDDRPFRLTPFNTSTAMREAEPPETVDVLLESQVRTEQVEAWPGLDVEFVLMVWGVEHDTFRTLAGMRYRLLPLVVVENAPSDLTDTPSASRQGR